MVDWLMIGGTFRTAVDAAVSFCATMLIFSTPLSISSSSNFAQLENPAANMALRQNTFFNVLIFIIGFLDS
ncbi:hypothetical protein [Flavobacterium sp. 3-210]